MVLSAMLDSWYIFLILVIILTSVVNTVYYLDILKLTFFYKPKYKFNLAFENIILYSSIITVNYSLLLKK